MEPILNSPTPLSKGRSTFLIVICILSFIGSSWGIIGSIRSYLTADTISSTVSKTMSNVQGIIENNNAPGFVKRIYGELGADLSPEKLRMTAVAKLLANLLMLAGAILMWNLNRIGFFLYIAGVATRAVFPLFLFGGLLGSIGSVLTSIVGVIFIVMYAANLKEMRRR